MREKRRRSEIREKEEKDKGRNSAHAEIIVKAFARLPETSDFHKQWLVRRVNSRIFVSA